MNQREPDANYNVNAQKAFSDGLGDHLGIEDDKITEEILENVKKTPVGKLLKQISLMPEVRQEKVLKVRRELSQGNYELNDRLDAAIDNILEELIAH